MLYIINYTMNDNYYLHKIIMYIHACVYIVIEEKSIGPSVARSDE